MFVVLRWHDPAVVEFEKLYLAVRQQDQARHEVVSVWQIDIEDMGPRRQPRHPEEAMRIGRRRAPALAAAAEVGFIKFAPRASAAAYSRRTICMVAIILCARPCEFQLRAPSPLM